MSVSKYYYCDKNYLLALETLSAHYETYDR